MKNVIDIPLYLYKQWGTSEEETWLETTGEELEREFPVKTVRERNGVYQWIELDLCRYHPISKKTLFETMLPLINQHPKPLHWTIFFSPLHKEKNPDGGRLLIGLYNKLR